MPGVKTSGMKSGLAFVYSSLRLPFHDSLRDPEVLTEDVGERFFMGAGLSCWIVKTLT